MTLYGATQYVIYIYIYIDSYIIHIDITLDRCRGLCRPRGVLRGRDASGEGVRANIIVNIYIYIHMIASECNTTNVSNMTLYKRTCNKHTIYMIQR